MSSVTAMPAIRIVSVSRISASSGRRDEVLLQQVVGDRRLHLDAGELAVSSGVATISRVPSAVAPTKTMRVGERGRGRLPLNHVGRRDVTERSLAAAIAEQQVAAAVERHFRAVEDQGRRVDVRGTQRDGVRIVGRHHRGQREARIDSALELDQHRHAPERTVGVGHGVEKAGRASGPRQRRQAADGAGRVENRRLDWRCRAGAGSAG